MRTEAITARHVESGDREGEPARTGRRCTAPARRDYAAWSIEELRAFARQLQVPNAAMKSRGELLGIFGIDSGPVSTSGE